MDVNNEVPGFAGQFSPKHFRGTNPHCISTLFASDLNLWLNLQQCMFGLWFEYIHIHIIFI